MTQAEQKKFDELQAQLDTALKVNEELSARLAEVEKAPKSVKPTFKVGTDQYEVLAGKINLPEMLCNQARTQEEPVELTPGTYTAEEVAKNKVLREFLVQIGSHSVKKLA